MQPDRTAIFISYRRSGGDGHARALYIELSKYFDPGQIFFDKESIEAGGALPGAHRQRVHECWRLSGCHLKGLDSRAQCAG